MEAQGRKQKNKPLTKGKLMPKTTKPYSEEPNVGPSSKAESSDQSKNSSKSTSNLAYKGRLFPDQETVSRQKLQTEPLLPSHRGIDYKEEREQECCTIV